MITTIGKEENILDMLNHLIELDFDAIEAYNVAIPKLETESFKNKLMLFKEDHVRHTHNLSVFLKQAHREVASGPTMKQYLTKGKVMLAELMGDKSILHAMRSNEEDTNTAYDRATKHPDVTPDLLKVLQENFEDEKRHLQWIHDTIQTL